MRPSHRRHHASKHFKKEADIFKEDKILIDTEAPDTEVMEQLARQWWNAWSEEHWIRKMTTEYLSLPDKWAREEYTKKEFYWLAKHNKDIFGLISRTMFNLTIKESIPYWNKWLKELDRSRLVSIKGELEQEILSLFGPRAKMKFAEINHKIGLGNHPEKDGWLESELKSCITRLVKKGALSQPVKTEWGETYYYILAKFDNEGWYIDKLQDKYSDTQKRYQDYLKTRGILKLKITKK